MQRNLPKKKHMPERKPIPELIKFNGRNNQLNLIPNNRKVNPRKDLLQSMSKWGCQSQVQIIKTNAYNPVPGIGPKKLYILDGQHRAATAATLDIDFYGVILDIEPTTTKEIDELLIDLNNSAKNWNIRGYVNHYIGKGIRAYRELKRITKENVYTMNTIAVMLLGKKGHSAKQIISKGKFKVYDKEGTLETLDLAAKLSQFGILNSRMLLALNEVRREDGFNEEKFIRKYKEEYPNLKDKKIDDYRKEFRSW